MKELRGFAETVGDKNVV